MNQVCPIQQVSGSLQHIIIEGLERSLEGTVAEFVHHFPYILETVLFSNRQIYMYFTGLFSKSFDFLGNPYFKVRKSFEPELFA